MLKQRQGFTLIELLIVVVIIGILAAIAIPKFSKTREKAYFSAMKSDLKNLATQQEIYYATKGYKYADAIDNKDLGFAPSQAVVVTLTVTSQNTGWAGYATHAALAATQKCAVYYGEGTPPESPATTPGVVTCTGE